MKMPSRLCSAATLALLTACRTTSPPEAIDPNLAARVPTSAVALAGVDLDRLRTSPLYQKLPPAAQTFLAPFAKAQRALIASDGRALLVIARGEVPGATQAAPGIALFGAPDLIASAQSAHAPAAILTPAARVAPGQALWLAIRGGMRLPLPGDLDNLNNLLRGVDWLSVTVAPPDPAVISVTAECPTVESAQHWEQTIRALTSMTAATTRDPQLAATLHALRLERTVKVSLTLPLDALPRFGQ